MRKKREVYEKTDSILRAYGRELVPDARKKQETLLTIDKAIEKKSFRYTPSPLELFYIQLQYISPAFWCIQGAFLLAMILLLGNTGGERGELSSCLWWASLIAAWMGLAGCGELGRHLTRGMAELEQSCYVNLPQMWTMRMILSGGVDILLLGICGGGIARNTQAPLGQVCVYLLVPFVLSNLCCLSVLTALRGGRGRYGQTVLAVLTAMLALAPSIEPAAYKAEHLWVWVALLLVGTGFLVRQLRQCYRRIMEGEILCRN